MPSTIEPAMVLNTLEPLAAIIRTDGVEAGVRFLASHGIEDDQPDRPRCANCPVARFLALTFPTTKIEVGITQVIVMPRDWRIPMPREITDLINHYDRIQQLRKPA